MKKIIIVGCPGSGKSTFSRRLNEKLNLPLYHMDLLFWNSDKTNVEKEVLNQRVKSICATDAWMIDGNYQSSLEYRISMCDTVFFLDYPLEVCLKGVESRRGQARPDMPWIEEEEDSEFTEYIVDFSKNQVPMIYALLAKYPEKKVIIFKNREEALEYLGIKE